MFASGVLPSPEKTFKPGLGPDFNTGREAKDEEAGGEERISEYEDLRGFFHAKREIKYEEQRSRIAQFCRELRKKRSEDGRGQDAIILDKMSSVNLRYIQYNPDDKIAYCGIPKVRQFFRYCIRHPKVSKI